MSESRIPRGLAFKAIFGLVVQVGCLAVAVYVIVSDGALPGASMWARVGLAFVCLAVSLTFGEVIRQREVLRQFIQALQSQIAGGVPRDDKKAVDTLVGALASEDESTRAMAHKHLVRLTGKELPPIAEAWETWWKDARPGFRAVDGRGG